MTHLPAATAGGPVLPVAEWAAAVVPGAAAGSGSTALASAELCVVLTQQTCGEQEHGCCKGE